MLREIVLVKPQGHPYSNDDDEPAGKAPAWFYWLVIGLIGVGIGLWLRKATNEKKRD